MTKNGLKRALSLLLSVIFVFCASFLPASAADSKENRGWRGNEKTE